MGKDIVIVRLVIIELTSVSKWVNCILFIYSLSQWVNNGSDHIKKRKENTIKIQSY